jgi:hypothetical protein
MTAIRRPYGPIDEAALIQFGRELQGELPPDLRQFLLESNGAKVTESAPFEDVPGGAALAEIFGLHAGPPYLRLDEMNWQCAELVPEPILVFAGDAYGNYFGVSIFGEDFGHVYFIDHERLPSTRDSLICVATSFTAFLNRARCIFALPAAPTTVGEAPLMVAARAGRADMALALLRRGADPNLRCGQGGTALGAAGPWPEVVDALLRTGAIPKATR